jgi:hypothetical protein
MSGKKTKLHHGFNAKAYSTVDGSGGTIFDVTGNSGQLFSVTDSLEGEIFVVSDISGIPILTVDASLIVKVDGDLDLTDTSTNQLILPLKNDTGNPTLSFGDGSSGIYSPTEGAFYITVNGGTIAQINSTFFGFTATSRGAFVNEAATATNPNILTHVGTVNTGVGGIAGELSLIVGGIEGLRIQSDSSINIYGNLEVDKDVSAATFNSIALTTAGVATNYLDETGAYSVPPSVSYAEDIAQLDASIVRIDASLHNQVTFGTDNQIPIMNGTTDFDYTANFSYEDGVRLIAQGAGTGSLVIGGTAAGAGNYSVALGYAVVTNDFGAIGIGSTATSKGNSSIAIGVTAGQKTIWGDHYIAIGNSANGGGGGGTVGEDSIALGRTTHATSIGSIGIGRNSNATAQGAILMGYHTSVQTNSTTDSFMLAWDGTTVMTVGLGDGMVLENATGGDQGLGTINTKGVYVDGTELTSGAEISGTPSVNEVAIFGGDGSIYGDSGLTFDGGDVSAATFNGVALTTAGSAGDYLSGDGTYDTLPDLSADIAQLDASIIRIDASLHNQVTFGTNNKIPFMNSGGTDFEYDTGGTYDGLKYDGNSLIAGGAGSQSISIGPLASATTSGGLVNPIAIGTQAVASGAETVALGYQATAEGFGQIAIGAAAGEVTSGDSSLGLHAISIGTDANSGASDIGPYSMALGNLSISSGSTSIAIGYYSLSDADNTIAIGNQATAIANQSIAIGIDASSAATGGIAIGQLTDVGGIYGIAIGYGAQSTSARDIAIGFGAADTTGTHNSESISIGVDSNGATAVIGAGSVAIGKLTTSTGSWSIAIGQSATTSNNGNIAIGQTATASSNYALALGHRAKGSGNYTIAIGYYAGVNATDGIAIGFEASAGGIGSTAIGKYSFSEADGAIIMGYHTSTQTNSVANSFELSWDGSTQFKVGTTYGTQVTSNPDPASNLVDASHGSLAWDKTDNELQIFDGTSWAAVGGGGVTASGDPSVNQVAIFGGDGSIYSDSGLSYDGTRLRADGNGSESTALGELANVNSGAGGIAIGKSSAGSGSADQIAIGRSPNAWGVGGISIGAFAGVPVITNSGGGISIGYNANGNVLFIGSNAVAVGHTSWSRGNNSIALGPSSKSAGVSSIAIGYEASSGDTGSIGIGQWSNPTGQGAIMMGYHSTTQTNSLANSFELSWDGSTQFKVGTTYGTQVTSNADPASNLVDASHGSLAWDMTDNELQIFDGTSWAAVGGGGGAAISGTPLVNQVAIFGGDGSIYGDASLAFDGITLIAEGTGPGSTVIGRGATCQTSPSLTNMVIIGTDAGPGNTNSVSIGAQSDAENGSVGIGYNAYGSGNDSVAIGKNALSVGTESISIGNNSDTASNFAIALGSENRATGTGGISLGRYTNTDSTGSIQIGYNTSLAPVNESSRSLELIYFGRVVFRAGTYCGTQVLRDDDPTPNLPDASFGSIVYDSSYNEFQGFTNGEWIPLGHIYNQNADVSSGSIGDISLISVTDYDGAFFDYVIKDSGGTNKRSGTIVSIWTDSSVNYNETASPDFGDTSDVTLLMDVSSGQARLRASVLSSNWNIKVIVRKI